MSSKASTKRGMRTKVTSGVRASSRATYCLIGVIARSAKRCPWREPPPYPPPQAGEGERSKRQLHQLHVLQRQAAHGAAGRGVDRVEDGRRGDADGRLADAAPEI